MRRWLGPADAVLQQATWWLAVACAARGAPVVAALPGAAAVVVHLAARPGERARVARAVGAAALYGLASDTVLSAAELVSFAGGALASPAWMVGLWAAFGAALTASLRAAARWPVPVLAAAAALAGPLAYRAGAALGALSFADPPLASILAIAIQWAIGAPLLARAAGSGEAERRHAARQPIRAAEGCD